MYDFFQEGNDFFSPYVAVIFHLWNTVSQNADGLYETLCLHQLHSLALFLDSVRSFRYCFFFFRRRSLTSLLPLLVFDKDQTHSCLGVPHTFHTWSVVLFVVLSLAIITHRFISFLSSTVLPSGTDLLEFFVRTFIDEKTQTGR